MDGRHRHPAAAGWRLSLIIPAYNEAAGIRQAVEEADTALGRLATEYEILVVDDGSSDDTADAVNELADERPQVRLLRHAQNRGYGAALRTGFEAAQFDRVAFTDADCQFHLDDLALLVPLTDDHPLAVGYRIDRKDPWRRRFISWGYNTLVRGLLGTGVRDCDCALKVFRKDALGKLLPRNRGFFVNTEMLTRARQLGQSVAETPVRHRPRLRGTSKVSLGDIPRTLAALLPFWWSEVLFAGRPDRRRHESQGRALDPGLLLLVLTAALLFFTRLNCPLLEPNEARYAEIPRQMLAEGRLLVPVLHGQPYYDKPPLLYWLVMGSYQLFGVHDWAARLIPGAAGFLTILLTYAWGRRSVGNTAGLAGALILCLSAPFVYFGRMLMMDGLLALWVVAALAAAQQAVATGRLRRSWWLLSAVACALGLLTKGPVALALVVVPIFAYQMLDPRTARVRLFDWLTYLVVAVGLACPWYVAVALAEPGFADYFFWKHNVLRFVAPFDHVEPIWFYLPGLLLGMLPWTLLLPALARFLGRRSARSAARRPPGLGYFLLASLWGLFFFSLAGCKRPGYILPVLPPLALVFGCYLDAARPRERLRRLGMVLIGHGSLVARRATLAVLAVGVIVSLTAACAGLLTPAAGTALAGIAGAGFGLVWRRSPGLRAAPAWALCGAATFTLLLAGVYQLLPAYNRRFSLRGQVRPHAELLGDPQIPVACYPRRWDSVSFYLQRNDVRVYSSEQRTRLLADLRAQSGTLVFIKSGPALEELLRDWPASLEFEPRGRQGNVTVAWVRPRSEAPPSLYAGR